jgi:hypothetical protein
VEDFSVLPWTDKLVLAAIVCWPVTLLLFAGIIYILSTSTAVAFIVIFDVFVTADDRLK